jgi:hypothetical protein
MPLGIKIIIITGDDDNDDIQGSFAASPNHFQRFPAISKEHTKIQKLLTRGIYLQRPCGTPLGAATAAARASPPMPLLLL